jgi:hypothetical protein
MPNKKPDPQCKECKGTGQITLLVSSCECDCVNRNEITPNEFQHEYSADWKISDVKFLQNTSNKYRLVTGENK